MTNHRQHTALAPEAYKALVLSSEEIVTSPWALDQVRYSSSHGKRMLELYFSGAEFSVGVPLLAVQELAKAKVKDLQELRLSPARDTIIAENLDAHISVEGLLKDLSKKSPKFAKMISTLFAAHAGKKKSERKRASSAENGRKGGRPRKIEAPAIA